MSTLWEHARRSGRRGTRQPVPSEFTGFISEGGSPAAHSRLGGGTAAGRPGHQRRLPTQRCSTWACWASDTTNWTSTFTDKAATWLSNWASRPTSLSTSAAACLTSSRARARCHGHSCATTQPTPRARTMSEQPSGSAASRTRRAMPATRPASLPLTLRRRQGTLRCQVLQHLAPATRWRPWPTHRAHFPAPAEGTGRRGSRRPAPPGRVGVPSPGELCRPLGTLWLPAAYQAPPGQCRANPTEATERDRAAALQRLRRPWAVSGPRPIHVPALPWPLHRVGRRRDRQESQRPADVRADQVIPLVAREHTTQVPNDDRLTYEDEFKARPEKSKVNVLPPAHPPWRWASNMGGLDAVALRNIRRGRITTPNVAAAPAGAPHVGLVLGYSAQHAARPIFLRRARPR